MLLLPTRSQNTIRLFSFGGGVQSHAVMALQALCGLFDYDIFVFANVGNDSENPATLEYIEKYTKPFCATYGLTFVEVQKRNRKGEKQTLMGEIERQRKSIIIPARMSNGAPGNRKCTSEFKIHVVDKYIKTNGYTHAAVGLGISLDEFTRMRGEEWQNVETSNAIKPRKLGFWRKREHPLIDLRITRQQCLEIIQYAGLPIPPKSSCFFCPFHKRNEWVDMRRSDPVLFDKAVQVEGLINAVRGNLHKDYVYLHPSCTPLRNAVAAQPRLLGFEEDACETGYCMT